MCIRHYAKYTLKFTFFSLWILDALPVVANEQLIAVHFSLTYNLPVSQVNLHIYTRLLHMNAANDNLSAAVALYSQSCYCFFFSLKTIAFHES